MEAKCLTILTFKDAAKTYIMGYKCTPACPMKVKGIDKSM